MCLIDRLGNAAVAGEVDAGGRVAAGNHVAGSTKGGSVEAGLAVGVEVSRPGQSGASAGCAVVESNAARRRSARSRNCGREGDRLAITGGICDGRRSDHGRSDRIVDREAVR